MIQEIEEFIKPIFDSFNYDFYVSESNKKEICDYQINSLFRIAKEQNINLMETGTKVTNKINELNNFGEYFKEVSFLNGFINITMSDKFIKNPSEIVSVGDIVKVKVIKIDKERQKVGLSMKGI